MRDVPRRIDLTRQTYAESLIRAAIEAVEEMGADERLTDAVVMLDKARESVADYVDNNIFRAAPEPTAEPEVEALRSRLRLWAKHDAEAGIEKTVDRLDQLVDARIRAITKARATRPPSEALRSAYMAGLEEGAVNGENAQRNRDAAWEAWLANLQT